MFKKNQKFSTGEKALFSFLPPFIAGGLGTLSMGNSLSSWYTHLNKPFFSPPNWIFGPVWTLLYFLMGWATFIVYGQKASATRRQALFYFYVQLILNALWSPLYFGLKLPTVALVDLLALLALVIYQTVYYYRVSKKTLWLLLPYILWLSFASVLNLSTVLLN